MNNFLVVHASAATYLIRRESENLTASPLDVSSLRSMLEQDARVRLALEKGNTVVEVTG
jgi:hypothetical protein